MAQAKPTAESARERAYLSWINSKISAVCPGMLLRSLDAEGMRNGTALAELIDAASASRINIKSPCTTEAEKIANIREILQRLRELNVSVSTIQPEDIVHGNKNSIMRLLLAISASFMPSHIHDVKHEIRDRHAAFGGQRVWTYRTQYSPQRSLATPKTTPHHATNVGSEAALAQNRLFPSTYRLQPITIHRLVPAVRPPLLHVTTAPVQQQAQQKSSKTNTTSLARRISSHIYNRNVDKDKQVYQQQQLQQKNQDHQSKLRSLENLVLKEEQPKPIRASKSLNALHGRTFVSKLVIPHLRNVRSISLMTRGEEVYEYSLRDRRLHSIPQAGPDSGETSSDLINRLVTQWSKCRGFKWSRLGETGRPSLWDRIAELMSRQRTALSTNSSSQQKSSTTRKTRGSTDGYVNHGFSDSPSITTTQIRKIAPPLTQIAKFRFDLAGVKSELMQLQEMLAANAPAESGITQTSSDYTLSGAQADENLKNGYVQRQRNNSIGDETFSRSSPTTIESLHRLLKVRTEAMDACLVDNAELRQAVGKLTTSLKQLQTENENLRQRIAGNSTTIVSTNGPRTWSFSSESIPNTPCSPLDTVQQTNFRLENGQPYSNLS
ncbi:Dixin [Taenia crassiceps]|uniref:Dixin n=1 Tax=Taenia crassiceps TaxID=6207 RepID=A0ABR4Q8W2_9CEST